MTKHSFLTHTFVAILLFVVSTLVFSGGGLYSTVLLTTAEVSGTLLSSGSDFAGEASRLGELLPVIAAVIINIAIYYFASIVILAVFGMLKKK